ncbi:VWA domain-containing protein [Phytomonospora sp. NPDC050363]|uniref:VWA domain-containing protein n=1 Tax=Phytomonospora sp. NPDC050363 TaxID=3155642 RepID=UPI0033DF2F1E
MIRLLQPIWLLALLPVLALAGAYIWAQRRRRVTAVRFSNLELLRDIAPKGLGWRRHAAAGVLLAALAVLAVGMTRPSVDIQEPNERATVVLAMDVSLSMMADDVAPTRMEAAKEAAKKFVTGLPQNFNVGLVSFAKTANVVVSPTKDRAQMSTAIDGLEMAAATATGEAVFAALQAIQSVPPEGAQGLAPARIVLLSDGYRTAGRFVEEASAAALAANVPVSTIAFGTDDGVVEIEGQTTKVPVDRKALAQLAEDTEGRYYEAVSGDELSEVYADMGSSIGYRTVAREIAQWFIGIGLVAAIAAAAMSLLWTSRIP